MTVEEIEIIRKALDTPEHNIHYIKHVTEAKTILNKEEKAISVTRCCETLKDNRILTFDGWCKIKNIHHSFDDYYLWDTTLLKTKQVLQMYRDFINNL